jgi:hypothetical protein
MRLKHFCLLLVVPFCFMLSGCPVSTEHPLTEVANASKYDKRLEGTWTQPDQETEATMVKISKGSEDNTYDVKVLKEGSSFAADGKNFTGWLADFEKMKFLVLKMKGSDSTYYIYHIEIEKDKLVTHTVSFLENGLDAITSSAAYREEVKASMKKEGFLKEEKTWKKD